MSLRHGSFRDWWSTDKTWTWTEDTLLFNSASVSLAYQIYHYVLLTQFGKTLENSLGSVGSQVSTNVSYSTVFLQVNNCECMIDGIIFLINVQRCLDGLLI